MTAPPPPPGWYPDPTGRPGQQYWDGRTWHPHPEPATRPGNAARRSPSGHRTAWFVLGGSSLLATAYLLFSHLAFNSRYCNYSPGQLCEEFAPLNGWLAPLALLIVLVVVIVAVALAVRRREYRAAATAFVLVTLVVPVMTLVPGSPLHPRTHFGNSSTTVLGSAPASPGAASSAGTSGSPAGLSPGRAKVTIDGQVQTLTGPVTCDDMGVGEQIYIGNDGGTLIQMLQTDPPKVDNLNFGASTSYDGVTGLEADPGNDATNVTASRDGNSWQFTGTAAGQKDHSSQFVTRTFEIDLTCP